MSTCCSTFGCTANTEFDARRAAADLKRYRKRGPDATTRMLLDEIRSAEPGAVSLLDIGSGIGVIAHELLEYSIAHATLVDASAPSLEVARQEATRRGTSTRCTVLEGDLVTLDGRVGAADLVTMHRVICCYPSSEPLLEAALDRAGRCFGYSYPRDRWWVRVPVWLGNQVRRLRRTAFRVYVHPPEAMAAILRRRGFRLVDRRTTPIWSVEVWRRDR